MTQVFRTLALIYPAANAKWGGRVLGRRSQRVMTREERDALHTVLGKVPAAVSSWSEGNAVLKPLDIVEVRRPLTSLSHVGAAAGGRARRRRPEVAEFNADGRYDSIYVLWPSDGQVQHCGWGCTIGPSEAAGGAGFSSIPSDHWPASPPTPTPSRATSTSGCTRSRGCTAGSASARTNCRRCTTRTFVCRSPDVAPFGQPYNAYHDGGARTWRPWYRDYMTGTIRRPGGASGGAPSGDDAAGCLGLTPERWALRGP